MKAKTCQHRRSRGGGLQGCTPRAIKNYIQFSCKGLSAPPPRGRRKFFLGGLNFRNLGGRCVVERDGEFNTRKISNKVMTNKSRHNFGQEVNAPLEGKTLATPALVRRDLEAHLSLIHI